MKINEGACFEIILWVCVIRIPECMQSRKMKHTPEKEYDSVHALAGG
jgi:hypothetical protein